MSRSGSLLLVLALIAAAPAAADDFGVRVLELVNAARAESRRCGWKRFGAAPPLVRSTTLDGVALAHAEDMAARGRMEHAGGDGSTPAERASRAGYAWMRIAENVAAGQSTPEQAVASWLTSSAHCANLMDAAFTETGIGVATAGAGGPYWAQVLGSRAP